MTRPAGTGAAAVVAAVLVGAWAVGVTLVLQALGWLADQALVSYAGTRPAWLWPAVSLVTAALVAGPAAGLVLLARRAAVRITGSGWLAGASATGLLGATRAVPAAEAELHLALLAVAAGGLALAWRRAWLPQPLCPPGPPPRLVPGRPPRPAHRLGLAGAAAHRLGLAAAAGLAALLPWLWLGALGGLLETLLALIAAAAVGWLAGTVLDQRFWLAFQGGRPVQRVLVGGATAGVTLLLIAAGTGGSGAQLPLLLMLPPLGFAAAGLAAVPGGSGRAPVATLVAAAVLGPLALVDAEEVSLLLVPTRDVPFWAGLATAGSLAVIGLLGVGLPLLAPRAGRRRWLGAAAATALAVAAIGVYAGPGQPGLHGERLFVVLANRADLSDLSDLPGRSGGPALPAATGQAGRDARAERVYQRLVNHAEADQAGIRADLDRLGLPYTPYYLVNALEVTGGPAVRAWLAGRADVDRVLRSQRLRPLPAAGAPLAATGGLTPDRPEWNIALLGAGRVWDELGITGAGVVVGIADSGVDGDHPALAGGFRGGADSWLDPWNGTVVPTDRNGHGTHTLGSAVGRGGIGVAPGARWAGCANLDRGLGNPARYLDCLQFLLAPYPIGGDPWRDGDPRRAPHLLTNSWACPPIEGCDPDVLRPATAALHAAGIYLVVAAGNAGPFCGSIQDPPATHPDVLTVGAVDRDRRVAAYSSRGPVPGASKPDLVAPGTGVVSALPGGGYRALTGTSMAAPQVAGVVALMWSANPALVGELETTTRLLRQTARPMPGPEPPACGGPPALAGAGLVDAYAAVRAALGPAG
jgi:subtilisin family serine protease